MTSSVTLDVAIAGLGAMGGAAAYHLARRGRRVVGFDRFAPPHSLGSSHGETRIIREAYFEDPRYVPVIQRAYTLWRELERESGQTLLLETGGLMIGPPGGGVVKGARASGDTRRLPYEMLDARELARRFPALHPDPDTVAVWEPRAGILFPEACVAAHLAAAARAGADLRTDEPVLSWRPDGEGVAITTPRGTYLARRLLLAPGALLPQLLNGAALPLTVTRQPLFWFQPKAHAEQFAPDRFGIFIWEAEPDFFFYGFPALEGRVKVTRHLGGAPTSPDQVDRELRPAEVAALRQRLARFIPDLDTPPVDASVCLYTNTADGHFVIDRHPAHPQVLVVSACSGHGFKFSSAIGEIAADLLTDCTPPFDLGLFRWR
ncbi:MAG: N-methyl-L-tryptophan oxidase [Planctomycetes bacterium]|nr:N-methyl-L-tryptophan oxidase [Planctomycetota bacterium]